MKYDWLTRDRLWSILKETVKSMPMYPHHKAYVRDFILRKKPDILPEELTSKLGITLGEALVLLDELGGAEGEELGPSRLNKPLG